MKTHSEISINYLIIKNLFIFAIDLYYPQAIPIIDTDLKSIYYHFYFTIDFIILLMLKDQIYFNFYSILMVYNIAVIINFELVNLIEKANQVMMAKVTTIVQSVLIAEDNKEENIITVTWVKYCTIIDKMFVVINSVNTVKEVYNLFLVSTNMTTVRNVTLLLFLHIYVFSLQFIILIVKYILLLNFPLLHIRLNYMLNSYSDKLNNYYKLQILQSLYLKLSKAFLQLLLLRKIFYQHNLFHGLLLLFQVKQHLLKFQ